MRRFIPKEGEVFGSREELEAKLLESGWEFEGHSTGFKGKEVISYNIGVDDEATDTWLVVDMVPINGGVKVTRVRKLKISDYMGRFNR